MTPDPSDGRAAAAPVRRAALVALTLLLAAPTVQVTPFFHVVGSGPPVEDEGRSRGVAWADFDDDGDPDLFVTGVAYGDPAPRPNALYRNEGGGRFVRVADPPTGIRDGESEGAAFIDVDNDGDLDLHVVGRIGAASVFYRNEGGGRLVRLEQDPLGGEVESASMACWADADGDGRLDVFIVGYRQDRNALYRNDGGWRFERVPLDAGALGSGAGRACAWGDLDGDRLPELVVANANQPNLLLRNRGAMRLVIDRSTPLQADTAYGYGLSWTDVNGDGRRDLFVANFDAGNAIYLGRPDGGLDRVALRGRLESAASKGHAWGDFDQDGREDLYLGSGTPAPGMLNRLYLAADGGTFRLEDRGAFAAHADTSAAVAAADFDLDGDLDLYVASWGGPGSRGRLYRNDGATGGSVRVFLEGVASSRMGIGARVSALVSLDGRSRWLHRWLDSSTGYAGQNEPVIHFGIGPAHHIDSLVVAWPSGTVDGFGAIEAGSRVRIREGAPSPAMNDTRPATHPHP